MLFHVNRRLIQLYYIFTHRIVFEKLYVFFKKYSYFKRIKILNEVYVTAW